MKKPTKNPLSARALAANCIASVLTDGKSLATALPQALLLVEPRDKGLLQELCYGAMRWFHRYNWIANQLLSKPFKPKDFDLQALIILGCYQLDHTRIPNHAALAATVEATRELDKGWSTGLINGVLRRYLREVDDWARQADEIVSARVGHPNWLVKAINQHWPAHAESIFAGNNAQAPMALRLKPELDRDDYIATLQKLNIGASAGTLARNSIVLDSPQDVAALPGFSVGDVSVQDQAAQLAGELLDVKPGQRVLDCCCAPGGKTLHLLQSSKDIELVALDADAQRLQRVTANLERAQQNATLVCADAAQPQTWWDQKPFDHILLDAPCSATGVIRRHPDIKLLRKPADIVKLAALQAEILAALWPLLSPGGSLVYATCSIMCEENTRVVEAFLDNTADAREEKLDVSWGLAQTAGRQLLPGEHGNDGFYYCKLVKSA